MTEIGRGIVYEIWSNWFSEDKSQRKLIGTMSFDYIVDGQTFLAVLNDYERAGYCIIRRN